MPPFLFLFLTQSLKNYTVVPERTQTTLSTLFLTEFPKDFETANIKYDMFLSNSHPKTDDKYGTKNMVQGS